LKNTAKYDLLFHRNILVFLGVVFMPHSV